MIVVLLVPREFLEVPDDSNFVLGGRLTLGNPGDSSFPGLLMRLFEVLNRRVGVDHPDDVFLVVGFFVHLTVTVSECYNRRYDVDFMRIRKRPSGKEIAGWMSPLDLGQVDFAFYFYLQGDIIFQRRLHAQEK